MPENHERNASCMGGDKKMHTNNTLIKVAILAKEHFNLSLPFSIGDLKKAHRKSSRELHPDLGGNAEKFKNMQSAYDFLLKLQGKAFGIFKETEIDGVIEQTVNGILLSELGLGLSLTKNGKDCSKCNHRGYTVRYGRKWTVCDYCDDYGSAPREFPCCACNGTGKFTQMRTKKVVDCRVCNGTGVFKHPRLKMRCPKCQGNKTIWGKDSNSPIYEVCDKCKGKGEVEIWNPVLRKGVLA